ncbi:class II glutamine amidotransferase [Propionicicella superfundia]|uniref:class II glutamine amidotransferase n=1 Tax=Propionicicella superfundia TaxID=348582 RepID=UPI00040AF1A6|nr:class II glutamine amidotransferase [Propionicicella superfundia]
MCRLMGVCTPSATPLTGSVPATLGAFRDLSRVHKDGWGLAWRGHGDGLDVRHGTLPGWQDQEFEDAVRSVVGDQVLVHLRQASPGSPVDLANCHPFAEGDVAFMHQGDFSVSRRLLDFCATEGVRPRHGGTDSELYFGLVLHHARSMPWHEAIAAAARLITRDGWIDDPADDPEALNCLLTTPEAMYGFVQSQPKKLRATSPVDAYELRLLEAPDRVVFASSGWELPGARALPERHVIEVARGSLRVIDHGLVPLG